jgi:FkbM family methyltransferase
MDGGLVFDLGMNDGSDTAFYLAKGFSVVGVDAAEDLCDLVRDKYQAEIDAGRLSVENVAVTESEGPVTFYPNEKSVWGTTRPDWAERNGKLAHLSTDTLTVDGVPLSHLLDKYGVPYYLKIDIEGADLAALSGLRGQREVPAFVSIESEKVSWDGLVEEFDALTELGYTRFKIVPQHFVSTHRAPKPAREGRYVPWRFHLGDSGLFGEEAPGRWLSRKEALARYRRIFARYSWFGDNGRFVPPSVPGAVVRRYLAGWYDTHAGR